jgi:hypothetical protein
VLAEYVQKFPELRVELRKRYDTANSGLMPSALEQVFAEVGQDIDLIAMIRKYAANKVYVSQMKRVVRANAVWREPVSERSNSFYVHPASVAKVIKELFEMLGKETKEAELAGCLIAIDGIRDEYGIAADDTRHPDVMSERPWPLEVRQPDTRACES